MRLEMLALRELGGDVPVSWRTDQPPRGPPRRRAAHRESLGDRARSEHALPPRRHRERITSTLRSAGRQAVMAGRAAADGQALAAGLDGLRSPTSASATPAPWLTMLAGSRPLLRRLGDLFLLHGRSSRSVLSVARDWDQAVAAIGTAIDSLARKHPTSEAWYVALGWLARLAAAWTKPWRWVGGRWAIRQHEHGWWRATACTMLGDTVCRRAIGPRGDRVVRAGPGRGARGRAEPTCCAAGSAGPRHRVAGAARGAAGWLDGRTSQTAALDAGLRGVSVARAGVAGAR